MSKTIVALLLLPLPLWFSGGFASESWPEFRGPTSDGRSEAEVPLRWSETENVRWKTPIHDQGWSTPVVHGTQVWLTTATPDGKEMFALCVDRDTGDVILDRKLFEIEKPRPLGNSVNCYASPSPAIDRDRVFLSFGSYGTSCLDTRNFEELWRRRDLPCNHFRGPASSPIRFGNLLILHMDGTDHHYVVALDKRSGRTVWRTPRSTDYGDLGPDGKPKARGDFRKAFSTPLVIDAPGGVQMVSASAKAAYGYDPRTGKELWTIRYQQHSTASRPVYDKGVAYINTGYGKPQLWAVRVDGRGDVTDSHVKWRLKKGVPNRSSPVLVDGLLYMVTDKGVASCLDTTTGEFVWQRRVGGNFSASLLATSGRVYLFSQEGVTTVIELGRSFKQLARNELDDGFMASPAVAGKAFFLRTRSHLYRIEK